MMGFGGFLGLGEDQYPLPWGKLHYDTEQGGYVTDVTAEQIEGAPERSDDWHVRPRLGARLLQLLRPAALLDLRRRRGRRAGISPWRARHRKRRR